MVLRCDTLLLDQTQNETIVSKIRRANSFHLDLWTEATRKILVSDLTGIADLVIDNMVTDNAVMYNVRTVAMDWYGDSDSGMRDG